MSYISLVRCFLNIWFLHGYCEWYSFLISLSMYLSLACSKLFLYVYFVTYKFTELVALLAQGRLSGSPSLRPGSLWLLTVPQAFFVVTLIHSQRLSLNTSHEVPSPTDVELGLESWHMNLGVHIQTIAVSFIKFLWFCLTCSSSLLFLQH